MEHFSHSEENIRQT